MTVLTLDERNDMLQVISDLSKSAYGYRVRLDYNGMSDEELQDTWDGFLRASDEAEKLEQQQQAEAWDTFLNDLNAIVESGAKDIATALRWDMDAYDIEHGPVQYDVGFYCYKRGIAYSKEAEITAMMEA